MENRFLQNCGDYLILDGKSNIKSGPRYLYNAHFEGYTKNLLVKKYEAKVGNIANPEKRDKYGFLCDKSPVNRHLYFVWKNMERRCYYEDCAAFKIYGLKGVTVSDYFKTYSNFENWYLKECDNDFNLELDKDCKSLNNKRYSEDTCILIPKEINSFLIGVQTGIYLTKYGKFCVRIRRKNKKVNKNFESLKDAKTFKIEQDLDYLNQLINRYNIKDETTNLLTNYVKICGCNCRICRNS